MTTSVEKYGRVPALDGIRGLAILSVMLFHFTWFALPYKWISSFYVGNGTCRFFLCKFILSGWAGVDLFFVLSGFLITSILDETRNQAGYFRVFYIRRILRIFPLYFIFIAATPMLMGLYPPALSQGDSHYGIWLWTYTSNFLISQSGWQGLPLPIQHLWSLAIEEQFYIIWPIIIFVLDRRKAIILCMILMVIALFARVILVSNGHLLPAYVLTYARFDALAGGALLALVLREGIDKAYLRFWIICLFIFNFTALVAIFVFRNGLEIHDSTVTTIGFSVLTLMFVAVIGLCILSKDTLMVRWVCVKPLRSLGKYSYGLYVFHQPVCLLLWSTGLMNQLLLPTHRSYPFTAILLSLVIPTFITMTLAIISWHAVEQHFLKIKDRFI